VKATDEYEVCDCGHEADDHLLRLDVTGNVYGPCKGTTSDWGHPCLCTEFDPEGDGQ
jgi:hypothetical protein